MNEVDQPLGPRGCNCTHTRIECIRGSGCNRSHTCTCTSARSVFMLGAGGRQAFDGRRADKRTRARRPCSHNKISDTPDVTGKSSQPADGEKNKFGARRLKRSHCLLGLCCARECRADGFTVVAQAQARSNHLIMAVRLPSS